MAPITGPEVERTAGDKGKCDGVGTDHPLAVLGDLAIAGGEEGGEGAEDPGAGLDVGSDFEVAARGEDEGDARGDEDGEDVHAAEDAMELQMLAAEAGGELERAAEQGEGSAESVGEEEEAVAEEAGSVGVEYGAGVTERELGGDDDEEDG